ncbi:glycosyltransferase [Leptothoe sp. EHU-05/26/07-4]
MEIKPSISVVIPAYNAARFLPEVIQSVLDQTYQDWELLVIDDGSTDNTATLVNKYCQLDSRIRLITTENGGVSAARNLGVELATTELIAFLDSDDLWLPDKLSVHVDYMNTHPEIGVSFARVELIDPDGKSTGKLTANISKDLQSYTFFYTNPTVTTSNVVIRKCIFQSLGGFDKSIKYSEDIDLLFRIAFQSHWTIEGIDKVLIQYRLHSSGLSSDIMKMKEGWIQLMDKARKEAPNLVDEHYRAAEAAHFQYWAKQTLRLEISPFVGISLINQALISSWQNIYQKPKLIVLTILIYLRLMTFNLVRVKI